MTDYWALAGFLLGGVNLGFVLKLVFNDIRHLTDKLDRHLELSEQLHREQETRITRLEASGEGKGPRGDPGPRGDRGDRGPRGDTGPIGPPGPLRSGSSEEPPSPSS